MKHRDDTSAPGEPTLAISGTYLVARSDGCTCSPHYGHHENHCGMEPVVDLSTLDGWEGLVEMVSASGYKTPDLYPPFLPWSPA